ncbi:VC0807 family protein [Streptomyces sp. NRRL S-337]|uniref:VC0807 family protein n=1 Tax=Streptomyces sp. NRRL S-337 TaxID=1463900 RepID=UPI00068D58E3|nr:VC0807 family protein [Streptomyces sp. NRRL S-337]
MNTVEDKKAIEEANAMETVAGTEATGATGATGGADASYPDGTRRRPAFLIPLIVNLLLPFVAYYVLRAQDIAQWQALLLSGAIPAAHAVGTAVVRRRVEFFDLLVVALLVVSAVTSLISGSPRVLLLKDAAIPAVLGVWILSSLFAARPLAYQFGRRLRGPGAEKAAERTWREQPDFRAALRSLTVLWGSAQLVDAALSTVEALTLPVDLVPIVGRFQSLGILAAMVTLTVRHSRAFHRRRGIPLFGP